jgi:TonB family protein
MMFARAVRGAGVHREWIAMKKLMLFSGMLLLAFALSAQAADNREMTYKVGADVDAQGHVTDTQFDSDVPPALATTLAAAVKQWQFVPARRDGRPVPAHTFVFAKLQAIPDARGNYSLRISFDGNGPRLRKLNVLPKYPRDARQLRQSAFLFLDATVRPDGRLADMTVSNRFEGWRTRPSFEQAVLEAAKRWRAIPEQVDGQPVATRVRIPVNFYMDFTAEQIRMLREVVRQQDAAETQPGIPLPSEQELALDSPLQPSSVAAIISAP